MIYEMQDLSRKRIADAIEKLRFDEGDVEQLTEIVKMFDNDTKLYDPISDRIAEVINKELPSFDGKIIPGSFVDFIDLCDSVEDLELLGALEDHGNDLIWELFRITLKNGNVIHTVAATDVVDWDE